MPDFSKLTAGLTGQASVTVTVEYLATTVGSGSVAVFSSPSMLALMEAAAVDCIEELLPPGFVSLGLHLDVTHSAPTPAGATVIATAELKSVEGRKLIFAVSAHDGVEPIGKGTHTRVIVDRPRFEAKLASKRIK
jgi:fluoroacetyl-CoA thioesterase